MCSRCLPLRRTSCLVLALGLLLAAGCATTRGATTSRVQRLGEQLKRETIRGNLFSYSNSREFPDLAFFGAQLARTLHREAAALRAAEVTVRQGDYLVDQTVTAVTHTLALLPPTGYGIAIRLRYDPELDRFHVVSYNHVLSRDFH